MNGPRAQAFEATDDAMLVEKKGERVFVLDGERTNFKITVPDDIWLAETMIRPGADSLTRFRGERLV